MRNVNLLCVLLFGFPNYSTADSVTLSSEIQKLSIEYWHNQLSKFIGVSADKVKLAQGNIIVGNSSYQLWNIYNAMSNYEQSIYYNPSQINNFSSGYGMVLYNLPVQALPDRGCKINQAILGFNSAKGRYAWNKTINDLNTTLNQSKPVTLNATTNISSQNNETPPSNYVVTIDANYQHFLTYYAQPYSQETSQLLDYSTWYSPCALFQAFTDKTSQYWQSTFGSNGYMQNVTIALIVAENGSMCIKISKDNQNSKKCSSTKEPSIIGVVISSINDLEAQSNQK